MVQGSDVVLSFIRFYIVIGFILAVMLNIVIIRLAYKILHKLEDREIHEAAHLDVHIGDSTTVAQRLDHPDIPGREGT